MEFVEFSGSAGFNPGSIVQMFRTSIPGVVGPAFASLNKLDPEWIRVMEGDWAAWNYILMIRGLAAMTGNIRPTRNGWAPVYSIPDVASLCVSLSAEVALGDLKIDIKPCNGGRPVPAVMTGFSIPTIAAIGIAAIGAEFSLLNESSEYINIAIVRSLRCHPKVAAHSKCDDFDCGSCGVSVTNAPHIKNQIANAVSNLVKTAPKLDWVLKALK